MTTAILPPFPNTSVTDMNSPAVRAWWDAVRSFSNTDALQRDEFPNTGLLVKSSSTVFTGRTITAGSGVAVTDGSGISGNPTIAVDIHSLVDEQLLDLTADEVMFYDVSSAANKKTSIQNLGASASLITGPDTSTDNALPRYDGITGLLLQDSAVIVDDSNNMTGVASIIADGNIAAGKSGTAGTLKSFPSTAAKGSFVFEAIANTGDTLITLRNAAMGQTSVISIPDPGASTSTIVLTPNTSSADNALCRFDGTTGKIVQSSIDTLDDVGNMVLQRSIAVDNIFLWGGTSSGATDTAVGVSTLPAATSSTQNTVVGYESGNLVQGADRNSFLGYQSGKSIVNSDDNSGFGSQTLLVATGSGSCAFGSATMSTLTSGGLNSGFGMQAGSANATGAAALTTGTENTMIGYRAGVDTLSAVGCLALGSNAVATKATGTGSGDNGPGVAIGSVAAPVGFRGDATIYAAAGASAGYWRVKINGTQYKINLLADA